MLPPSIRKPFFENPDDITVLLTQFYYWLFSMPLCNSPNNKSPSETPTFYPIFYTKNWKSLSLNANKANSPQCSNVPTTNPRITKAIKSIQLSSNQSYWLERQRLGLYPFDLKPGEECTEDQAVALAECEMIPLIAFQVYQQLTHPLSEEYDKFDSDFEYEEVEAAVEYELLHSKK